MTCGIYEIRNVLTGEIYVGKAVAMRRRWGDHFRLLQRGRHHAWALQRSWRRHGPSAFLFSAIEVVPQARLCEREQFWMDKLQPVFNVLKVAVELSPEAIQKMRESLRGRQLAEAHKQAISNGARRGKRPPDVIARVREAVLAGDQRRREAGVPIRNRTKRRRDVKLSDAQVAEIRGRWIPGNQPRWKRVGPTIKELAAEYGVGYLNVWKVLNPEGVRKCK